MADNLLVFEAALIEPLTEKQKELNFSEMRQNVRDKTKAVLLALLTGGIGGHHFYLGQWFWGLFYLFFCWTWVPAIVSVIECFGFIQRRVDDINQQAAQQVVERIRKLTS